MVIIPLIFIAVVFSFIFYGVYLANKHPFKVGDTVYWREVTEVGETNSQWTVTLKSGKVVSSDVRVCVEDNDGQALLFIEKEKLYSSVTNLKVSIGAKLTTKEDFWREAAVYHL